MAYGRGGTQPTVTDALVMLGILSTDEGFAGGSFRLQRDGIDAAFAAIGTAMGHGSAEQALSTAGAVVNANMSQGVRPHDCGQGIDPKDLVMLAYGGNGPAFAAIQAEDLGITKVLVPKASPTFSALGTLIADPMIDEERSVLAKATELTCRRCATCGNNCASAPRSISPMPRSRVTRWLPTTSSTCATRARISR